MCISSLEKKHRERWRGRTLVEKANREKRGFRDAEEPFGRESKKESGENKHERMVEGQGQ